MVYYYHYITGDWGDLLGFQNRYPTYADSFNIHTAITIARAAPDLKLGFTDDRLPVFQHYIELAAPVHQAFVALQQVIAQDLLRKDWEKYRRYRPPVRALFRRGRPRVALPAGPAGTTGRRPGAYPSGRNGQLRAGEYAPVISADGQLLLFCRNMGNNEDIYAARREGETWGAPTPSVA
ncbi:MAG: hypothetical protein H6559_34205 [Lewinellaceae bacterium]|nr:hypothetical protein [Lewinellaceae bacterium]